MSYFALTKRMGVKSDDEVDRVPIDVADEGLVAAREGHTHRLRDPRELEPLEEPHAKVAVGEVDGVRVCRPAASPSVGRRLGVVPIGHVRRVGRALADVARVVLLRPPAVPLQHSDLALVAHLPDPGRAGDPAAARSRRVGVRVDGDLRGVPALLLLLPQQVLGEGLEVLL